MKLTSFCNIFGRIVFLALFFCLNTVFSADDESDDLEYLLPSAPPAVATTQNAMDAISSNKLAFPVPRMQLELQDEMGPKELSMGLKLVFLLTVLTLAPSILIMMTPFTRILIVLSFTRKAIGTQTMPTDKMLVSLALFMTVFHMAPIWNQINDEALKPFLEDRLSYDVALQKGIEPLRLYMKRATREADLAIFVKMVHGKKPQTFEDVSTITLIPAFIISEFKTGFQFGVILFLPFLMLDMVIATTLMSMGMMMLPPAMVSTPFKLLLFVLIDGWTLIIDSLMKSIVVM